MALTHAQAALQAATDAVVDLIDVGAGANGTLELLDDTTVLSAHAFSATAFGAANAGGVATAAAIGDDTDADATGTADKAKIKDADGDVVVTLDAGQKRDITAVGTGAGGTFGIAGDHTTELAAGTRFNVVGSTGNDGTYTVQSSSYGSPTTTITVTADETVADATVDGQVHVGQIGLDNTSIEIHQTVSISALTYQALPA